MQDDQETEGMGETAAETAADPAADPAGRKPGRRRQTRQTILAATKELVARKGPHATTVRDITLASGANVAAVNYYFQSKDELVRLAADEITADINTERARRLDALEAAAGEAPLAPRAILQALVEPILDISRAEDGGSLYLRNVYNMRTVPYAPDNRRNFGQHDHVAQRFIAAIRRSFPALEREEAVWHYEFARGAALHMLANLDPNWRRFELILYRGEAALPETPIYALDQGAVDRVIDMILKGFGKS